MDAIQRTAPQGSGEVPVPADALAAIESAYESGLYLDAWRLAQKVGPLRDWTGTGALVLAGRLAGQLGARRLGCRLHLRAFRRDPSSDRSWVWAMRALRARRGPYVARQTMRRHDRAKDDAGALALRAEIAVELRDLDEADGHLARGFAIAPDDPWLHVVRAAAFREADAHDSALEAVDRALVLRPWFRAAVEARAELLVLTGREGEALAFLEAAVARLHAASVASELVQLQVELGRHAEAEATLARLESFTPLREWDLAAWIEARASDIAYHRGDRARAIAHARRASSPFHEAVAEKLAAPGPKDRVVLPVPWVRQQRLTCAPATLSALARHFAVDAGHLEIAEAICYDGTPDAAQRRWAEERGLVAREFTVTWPAAIALLDRGVPFAIETAEPGNAHMRVVTGYDLARGTLLLRDPSTRYMGEMLGEKGLALYACCGPRGLAILPVAEAHRLDGLDLPETALHDVYHRVQAALLAHDRAAARAAAAELAELAPGHRIALQADRSIAAYDGDEAARLRAIEGLLALFPQDVNLRLAKQASLADLGRRDARIEWLRSECERAGHPLLQLALADVLRVDARAHDEALRLARAAGSSMWKSAGAYHALGRVLWETGERVEALVAYRTAACLERTDERYAESYFQAARLSRRADEAIAFLRDRFERQGRKAAWPAFTLYDALDVLDRDREAREVLERALAIRPDDGPLLLFAARAFAAAGETDAAQALLARAGTAARPADVKQTAAQLAEARGDLVEAAALWSGLADLEPFNLDAVRSAARLLDATCDAGASVECLRQRVERHPHHHGLCQLLAEALASGPPGEREAAIRSMIDANPSDAWAWRELALALAGAGRNDEALAAIERSGEIDPFSPAFYTVHGFVLAEAGRLDEAKESFRLAIRISVDSEWALSGLLRVSENAAERERQLAFVHTEIVRQVLSGDALPAYQRAAAGVLEPERVVTELRAAWEARPDVCCSWLALARQLQTAGRPEEAVDLLGRAADRFELMPKVWSELALAHRAAGNRREQRHALERALQLSPGWPEAVTALAELLHTGGEFEAERALLAHAVRRAPSDAALRGALAEACWASGRKEDAVGELERALRLDPGYSPAWNALVRFSGELGCPGAPIAIAERMAAQHAHDPNAWMLAARARESAEGKLEAIDRALALAPRHVPALELRMDVLVEAGRHAEAIAAVEAPSLAGPELRGLRLRAARLRAAQGDPAAARAALEELLQAEPDYAEGWVQLADWDEEAGRHRESAEASRRLVRLAPDAPMPRAYLARALLGAGEREEAKAELRRALALRPGYAWALLRLFEAEIEDGALDAAAELLPAIEGAAPDDAADAARKLAAARAGG